MTLFKTSALNAIAVFVKLLVGLFLNKILAVYVGPAGYAVIGQYQNAVTMLTGFASGAINNGVVKYTAEYNGEPHKQISIWQTATRISIYCTLVFSALILIFNKKLASIFLHNYEYGSIFTLFACLLIFFVLNTLLLAILNGKKDVRRYILSNIFGSIFMAIITGLLAKGAGLYGALLALSINQSITFFATLYLSRNADWFNLRSFWGKFDPHSAKKLGGFALMALTSTAIVPLAQILIRNRLGQHSGWVAAGYWQGIWKISEMYLMIVTTTLSVYYLPKFSELKDRLELRRELLNGYKLILPIAFVGSFTIYLLRDILIKLLFTSEFVPMRDFFAFQLIGDVIKIASWLLGYVLWGQALTKIFIITEIIFGALFVIISFILINTMGIEGVTLAYLLTYILYLLTLTIVLFKTKII